VDMNLWKNFRRNECSYDSK